MSGYDLRKDVERSGYFWIPAKTQIYATLPRLVEAGHATQQKVVQTARPDKTIYELTESGREALREWVLSLDGRGRCGADELPISRRSKKPMTRRPYSSGSSSP